MKKNLLILFPFCLCLTIVTAQQDSVQKEKVRYNGLVNIVPDGYNRFLLGIVNIARGNQRGFHNGIVNYNQKNFTGIQLSVVNYVGGNSRSQIGVFNVVKDTLKKVQIGVINISKVNNGLQLGVINYSDTINEGSAWSFITIVRRGGYYALEYYVSEMFPINASFKLGLSQRHNAFHISTDGKFNTIFLGGGLSVMRSISKKWFFNPEFSMQSALGKSQRVITLCPKFTYELIPRIYLSAGPSFVYNGSKTEPLVTPLYYIYQGISSNGNNKFVIGMRLGIRFNITEVKK